MNWIDTLKKAGYPTTAIVLDFETYFDTDYTLSKLSTIEYVKDKRFEVMGLGFQIIKEFEIHTPMFVTPEYIEDNLQRLKTDDTTIVCQNCKFDTLILQEHYGITPKYTVDTIDLDRIQDARAKHSLKAMAERYDAPSLKGDTMQFKGYRWADMSPEMRKAYEEYCKNDIRIESFLFQKLLPLVPNPQIELPLATQTLHLYLKPSIAVDIEFGEELKGKMEVEKFCPIWELEKLGIIVTAKDISGNISFKALLEEHLPDGESVPMKQGKNKLIPAFAKDDEGMEHLLNHPKKEVRLLAEARQAIKSWPLHTKRVDNLIGQAKARDGLIGAPLSYHSAHTGRWGGTEGINLQNLGGRGRAGQGTHKLIKAVRQMLMAPQGFVFGKGDLAQIEARVLAWFAGQDDLVQGFADGEDIYSKFAAKLFKCPVRKPRKSDPEPIVKRLTVRRGFGKDGILGCGFGMGALKFFDRCQANPDLRPSFESGEYDFDFIKKLINTYRTAYFKIPEFWQTVEKIWKFTTKYPRKGKWKYKNLLEFHHQDRATYITLPSGRYLRYPNASVDRKGQAKYRWGKLWGGSITENIVQACARDVLGELLLRLEQKGFNLILHVHDEAVCLLEKNNAKIKLNEMLEIMKVVPDWAVGLPLDVEGSCSKRYGGE